MWRAGSRVESGREELFSNLSLPLLPLSTHLSPPLSTREPALHTNPLYTRTRSTREPALHTNPLYTRTRSTHEPVLQDLAAIEGAYVKLKMIEDKSAKEMSVRAEFKGRCAK